MNTITVPVLYVTPVSFRSAWLIRRACRPMCWSPISPSISALGVRAATESTTTRSIAPDRTSISAISSACSPVSGCDTSKRFGVDADAARVLDVERVLGVDERAHPAAFLSFGDGVESERGLAARLGSVDLDDAAARVPAHAGREVERERASRDRLHGLELPLVAQRHDGALAELFLHAADDGLQYTHFLSDLFQHDDSPFFSCSCSHCVWIPVLAVEHAHRDRFCDVLGADVVSSGEVGDGAGDANDLRVCARR